MYDEFVYVLKAGPYYKIGRTKNITKRIAQIDLLMPFEVELFKVINTDDSRRLEARFHRGCSPYRRNGEWFELPDKAAALLLLFPPSVELNGEAEIIKHDIRHLVEIARDYAEGEMAAYWLEYEMEARAWFKDEIEARAEQERYATGVDYGSALIPLNLEAECPYDLTEDTGFSDIILIGEYIN